MKHLRLFEQFEKEIIDVRDLDSVVRSNKVDVDEILIRLPDGKLITFDEYVDGGYHQIYSKSSGHLVSPSDKKNYIVPEETGSKKRRGVPRYWER